MYQPTGTIVTPRLRLRSLAPTDLQLLHDHVLSDAAVMAVALSGQPMSLSQSREFIDRSFDHDGSGKGKAAAPYEFGVKASIVGEPDYELGFVLRRSAWGHGYATEIGRGQLDYGFNVLGLTRLLALVSPINNASITALRKIGMEFHSAVHDAQRGDRHVYIARNDEER